MSGSGSGSGVNSGSGKGRLFDLVADDYDEVRPSYPDEVYDAIDALRPLSGARVLDLAAGTCTATRQLLDRGAHVVAVDPGLPMLRRLRRGSAHVAAVVATAERLPFATPRFDVVCCATAWHWLDTDATVEALRRVIRPRGLLALWWANHRRDDGLDWERAQGAVHDRWAMKFGSRPPTTVGVGPRDAADDLRRRGLDVVVDTELTWSRTVTRETHLRVIGTHSDVLALGERRHEVLAEIAAALAPWETVEERLWGSFVIARFPPPAE
jgi:SAM-dependent methyltransferase